VLHPSEHDLRLFAGLAGFAASILSVPTALASTLVVIIAVDQGDSEIAPAMAASGLAIGSAVALSVPEPKLVLRDVPTEGPFHAAVIIRAIRNAPVGPDDALMLYYGGHKAYDEPRGTYLLASGDEGRPLFLSQIREELRRKSPHLGVLLMDCCNELRPVSCSGEMAPEE